MMVWMSSYLFDNSLTGTIPQVPSLSHVLCCWFVAWLSCLFHSIEIRFWRWEFDNLDVWTNDRMSSFVDQTRWQPLPTCSCTTIKYDSQPISITPINLNPREGPNHRHWSDTIPTAFFLVSDCWYWIDGLHPIEWLSMWEQLSGSIPSSLGNCSKLFIVSVSNNLLSELPDQAITSATVITFRAGNNLIEGTIPESMCFS